MRHLGALLLFAALVAVVFGVIGRDEHRAQARYGIGVFIKFVGIGLALAWLLYFL